MAVLAVVIVVVAAGGAAVAVLALSEDRDGEAPAAGLSDVDLDFERFRDPDGAYELVVPVGWASTPVTGDISGLGRQMFPDDQERATAFQQMADILPRAIIFLSIDSDEIAVEPFADNFNLVRVPDPDNLGFDELAEQLRAGIQAFGGEPTGEDRLETGAGEAVRIEYDLVGVAGVSGIQYAVGVPGEVWTLTYTSDQLPATQFMADTVAASFELTG